MMLHVNHASYVRWAESMRAEYFARVMKEPINGSRGMILAKLEFTYERQLDYREAVAVGCTIPRIGTKSFDFLYEIWSEDHSARAAFGTTTMVAFDYRSNASIAVPEEWRKGIASFEGGPQELYR